MVSKKTAPKAAKARKAPARIIAPAKARIPAKAAIAEARIPAEAAIAEAHIPAKAAIAEAHIPAEAAIAEARIPAEAAAPVMEATPAEVTVKAITAIQEGTIEMKNEMNEAVTDRVQAIFGDVNERARSAFEKNARLVEELSELTRGNVEAIVASSKVAAKGVEALSQDAAEYGRKSFEDASSAFRSFAEVKSAADLFRLQSDFAKTQFDSIVSESSKMSEAMLKLAGEMFEPLSSRYSVAAERVKNVVAA